MRFSCLVLSLCPTSALAAPSPPLPDAKATFAEVMRLVDEHYVDPNLDESARWQSAIEGVLDDLIQVEGKRVNALLSPEQLAELQQGLKASVTGIGVVVEMVQGVVVIKEVIVGGPALGAGLRAGDRVLSIDERPVEGSSFEQVVQAIRGPSGTSVRLFVQRGAEEWVRDVKRAEIAIEPVVWSHLPDAQTGYLRIHEFSGRAAAELERALASLVALGVRALVVDLRGCPGGLFEQAVEVADRFLDPGEPIVTARARGGAETVYRSKAPSRVGHLPLAVLIDGDSASGAEIVAAALADARRATLVGERTLGKGTMEKVLKLKNGWGLKLTVGRLVSPRGTVWQGKGLEPHFPVKGATGPAGYSVRLQIDPARDPQLRTAVSVLRMGSPR